MNQPAHWPSATPSSRTYGDATAASPPMHPGSSGCGRHSTNSRTPSKPERIPASPSFTAASRSANATEPHDAFAGSVRFLLMTGSWNDVDVLEGGARLIGRVDVHARDLVAVQHPDTLAPEDHHRVVVGHDLLVEGSPGGRLLVDR